MLKVKWFPFHKVKRTTWHDSYHCQNKFKRRCGGSLWRCGGSLWRLGGSLWRCGGSLWKCMVAHCGDVVAHCGDAWWLIVEMWWLIEKMWWLIVSAPGFCAQRSRVRIRHVLHNDPWVLQDHCVMLTNYQTRGGKLKTPSEEKKEEKKNSSQLRLWNVQM